ncbi:hypothetical protein GT022_09180 [Agaribacter marinus]|uniref:PepSY domain-containing protein n=1 Tax=Virgibacillus salarius TaxID=447199 RepID=A0A941DVF4_9BACI|nr:PepSY domain-containing protein [Virgibacillus salarius]MBR7796222.1 PepSY domain-containing protein [Virgibacillus salarius]NAZ08930.1 hypothetical protein [Agaribacter marinus]
MNKKVSTIIASIVAISLLSLGIFYFSIRSSGAEISKLEAENIITSQYPGSIHGEVEKDETHGYFHAIIDHKGKAYDIQIDENTGKVLNLKELSISVDDDSTHESKEKKEKEQKADSNNDKENQQSEKEVIITKAKARVLALEQFEGTIEELELDEDDGRMVYEVQLVKGEDEADITIDAFTGEVIYKDIERDNDD